MSAGTSWPAPLLAHAGEGSTWQALLVAIALGIGVIAVLALVGKVRLDSADDLVLPLASVAVLSSLAPLADYWLSDHVGWAFPAGLVVLVGLVVAALSPLDLSVRSPLTYGVLTVAIAAGLLLHQPLTRAWHPPPEYLPLADDAEVELINLDDGDVIEAGTLEVVVSVTGGSIGPGDEPVEELPADPEEAGDLTVLLDQERLEVSYLEDCRLDAPCDSVTFPVELEPGERTLVVEFTRGDGTPLAPYVADDATFEVR